MIEHIEEVSTDLEPCRFGNGEVFSETEIEVDETGASQRVSTQVADSLAGAHARLRYLGKGRLVNVLQSVSTLGRGESGIPSDVVRP